MEDSWLAGTYPRLRKPISAGIVAMAAVLAACGSSSPAGPAGGGDGNPPDMNAVSCTPSGSVGGWRFTRLGVGTKPAIAVEADGTVHATFMIEATAGVVRYARLPAGASSPGPSELAASGYFYGPIDIVLGDDGEPRILYHDHDREDQVLAIRSGGTFTLQPMTNTGHDGWYNTGVISPDGTLHTATYDPRGFSGRGLNYGAWDGSNWRVELAAAGSFDYAGGTAIVYIPDGIQAAFFDDSAGLGKIATRQAPNTWTVATIEPLEGRSEVGRFPDMELDPDGSTLHLVYLALDAAGGGVVRYAKGTPGAFEFQDLISVTDFTIGFSGARDIATLHLDGSGDPVVAIQTRSDMTVLRVGGQGVETLAEFQAVSGIRFGQQTEVVVDEAGQVHVTWWQSGESPGTVCHGVTPWVISWLAESKDIEGIVPIPGRALKLGREKAGNAPRAPTDAPRRHG